MSNEIDFAILDKLIVKIANLDMMGVQESQIAKACALSPGRISQIMETDKYKEHLASVNSKEFEQRHTIAQGLSAIEEEATNVILTQLMHGAVDGDFALRALKVANSANRNPNSFAHAGNTMNPTPGHASIKLPTAYIEKLQQINVQQMNVHVHPAEVSIKTPEKKIDQMSVSSVRDLFKAHLQPITIDAELVPG